MYSNFECENISDTNSLDTKVEYSNKSFNVTYRRKNLISCGIIMYRIINSKYHYLCVHPGGPYFKNKDKNCWSIPKGVVENNESLKDTACREFTEETGITLSKELKTELLYLGAVRQKGGKIVHAWVVEDPEPDLERDYKSNTFEMEYPKNSGNIVEFPEVDKIDFFISETARDKLNPAQSEFIKRWELILKNRSQETKIVENEII
jgi:predicted NUDIX family NTP pyrophosphohydrolase